MFKDNKYTKWYFNIVNAGRSTKYPGYTERHHILPRAMGGTNQLSNLVDLTARQHFICHLLLTKMSDNKRMALALSRMMGGGKRYTPRSSKIYEMCKRKASEAMRGAGNPMFGVSQIYSEERRQKLKASLASSEAMIRRNADPKWKESISAAQRLKMRPINITSVITGKILFTFNNHFEAAEVLGCSECNIVHALKDQRQIGKKMKSLGERCLVTYAE